jgi:hypothetical protein
MRMQSGTRLPANPSARRLRQREGRIQSAKRAVPTHLQFKIRILFQPESCGLQAP